MREVSEVIKNNQAIYYVRQAKAYLFLNLLLIQIVFLVAFVLIVILITYLNSLLAVSLSFLIPFIFIALILTDVAMTLRLLINWKCVYYVIRPGSFMIKAGWFQKREKLFELNQIETCTIRQSIFGRKFNFGTISIYSPLLQERANIFNVSEPRKYEKILLSKPILQTADQRTTIIPDDSSKLTPNLDGV